MRTAGGESHQITGKGSVHFTFPSGEIKKVDEILYVPGFNKNLLSIGSLTDRGIVACFDDKKCILYSRGNKQIIAEGLRNKQNGLYHLSAIKTDVSVNIAQTDVESTRLWHHWLSHISYDRLHELSAKGLATGLPYIPIHREICDQCQAEKQTRESFPHQSLSRASHPLQLLHVDLCGPLLVTSLGCSSFFLVIIDDFSRYIWVHFLRHKAIEKFKIFKTMIELQTCQRICAIRSDRGGEFLSLKFTKLCESTGIVRQLTNANTPEQNGVAERANRKLLEMARSMIAHSSTPRFLWTEAINTAAFIINRSPTIAISGNPFPPFLWNCT